jgi:hypothetical protein
LLYCRCLLHGYSTEKEELPPVFKNRVIGKTGCEKQIGQFLAPATNFISILYPYGN